MLHLNRDTEDSPATNVSDAVAAGISIAAAQQLEDLNLALIPPGCHVQDLDKYLETPRRIDQHVSLEDIQSFEFYWSRFSDETSIVFASRAKGLFRAVLDYHGPEAPSHATHTATFALTETEEWRQWIGGNGRRLNQTDFAEFIEKNIDDIATPSGSEMLERVRHIQAARNVQFNRKVDLDSGDIVFNFASETAGKGQASLPERFELGIAPFEGTDAYKVQARLRYRIDDEGNLTLWYELIDAKDVRRDAIDGVIAKIHEITDNRVLMGSL